MPYMTNGKRDYAKEKALYEDKHPERKKARAERNKARHILGLKVGDPRDAGHVKAESKGGKTVKSNLAPQSAHANRSFARNKDGSMKSELSKKEKAAGKQHTSNAKRKGY
jgi:hypothetical protein